MRAPRDRKTTSPAAEIYSARCAYAMNVFDVKIDPNKPFLLELTGELHELRRHPARGLRLHPHAVDGRGRPDPLRPIRRWADHRRGPLEAQLSLARIARPGW